MRMKRFFVILLAVLLSMPVAAFAQRKKRAASTTPGASTETAVLPPIKFTQFTLSNGLRVILHEDHSTPIVAVNVWYHVGSKNEVPGRTGFAHLFEHMMFQGSLHHDKDFFVPLQEAGGTLNGSTNTDRTNYWEVVPSNFLELALWLESDRMGYLLEALTDGKLANQRDVVKNEKRQNYDNRPYGLASAKIAENMYPKDHPYHWLTIGSLDDLTAASREDVSNFFRRFYTPNNASLSIGGDFNPGQARALVEKYFGPIKRGPEIQKVAPPRAMLETEKRLTMEDRVGLPRVYMSWHTEAQYTSNDAPLDQLAFVLAGGKGSRLYRSLVYEKQIAQDVSAFHNSREIAGQFSISATAKPDVKLEELERAIDEEIAKLKTEPPSNEELERAYNARESSFIYGLQTVGGFGGKSDQLNQYAVFLNQPGYFQTDLLRYRSVTPADVTRVASGYLTHKRLVLTVTPRPRGKTTGDAAPPSPTGALPTPSQQTGTPAATTQTSQSGGTTPAGVQPQTKPEAAATMPAGATPTTTSAKRGGVKGPDKSQLGGLYAQPKPQADPRFRLPQIQRRKLSNGLEVLIVEQHEVPVVNMNLVLRTGAAADPQGRAGLANLTAALIDEGTKTRSSLDISNQLAALGARLSTGSDFDNSAVNLLTLSKHLDRALEIYSDVVTNPSFPPNEVELQRKSRLAQLMQRRDDANAIAGIVYASLLYGRNHPYGHPGLGDEQSVRAIANDEIRRFYETYYRPNNAALIVAGDVTPDTLIPRLERAFAGWKRGDVPAVSIEMPPAREKAMLYIVDKPGAAQSVVMIGQVGQPRSTPDYFPLIVMNSMLGGQFTSRVNMNLREEKGYTYGARTSFDYRRSAGPFAASAGVQTAVTKESVFEFLKELRGIRGERPVTTDELEFSKQAIIRGFPRTFETSEQIANRLTDIVVYNLPDDYFNKYIAGVRAVTVEEVNRVANRYLDPSRMAILVVGDRKVIEAGLRSLTDVGTSITFVDPEGRPSSDGSGGGSVEGGGTRR